MAVIERIGSIQVLVCYAEPRRAREWAVELPAGATVADALAASGYGHAFPGQDPFTSGVGVFGVRRGPEHLLTDGDRVEIYRPLVFDPKESRRRRAAHKARSANT